jgi:hypothetical protein
MKLLLCESCGDIFNLVTGRTKACHCGAASGRYLDDGLLAQITGGIPLGVANASFEAALHLRPRDGLGSRFTAFVIPTSCPTIKVLPTPAPLSRFCRPGAPKCCDRADEYNGFATGPLRFTCPNSCGCHD